MNVHLTPELAQLVRTKVQGGRYNSVSEVVREALPCSQSAMSCWHSARTRFGSRLMRAGRPYVAVKASMAKRSLQTWSGENRR